VGRSVQARRRAARGANSRSTSGTPTLTTVAAVAGLMRARQAVGNSGQTKRGGPRPAMAVRRRARRCRTHAAARHHHPQRPRRHRDADRRRDVATRLQRVVHAMPEQIEAALHPVFARDQPQLGAADALVERQLRWRLRDAVGGHAFHP
jgi:hypothetical protein